MFKIEKNWNDVETKEIKYEIIFQSNTNDRSNGVRFNGSQWLDKGEKRNDINVRLSSFISLVTRELYRQKRQIQAPDYTDADYIYTCSLRDYYDHYFVSFLFCFLRMPYHFLYNIHHSLFFFILRISVCFHLKVDVILL